MPPKKKLKPEANQRKLSFFSPTCDDNTVDHNNNTSVTVGQNKIRRDFKQKWLGVYSWLRYVKAVEDKPDYMYCNICEEHNVKNGMCKAAENRNFQNSTLTRHADLPDHRKFILAPALKSDFVSACKNVVAEQDEAVTAMIRILHWIVQEDLPLAKFKPLVELMNSFHVKDIELLNKSKINYQSPVAVYDLLDSLADFAQNNVKEKLTSSEFVTVLTDESTDICNNKRQVIYAQVLNDKFVPETLYVTNVECCNATGVGIAEAVLNEMAKRGISPKKIMSLGSDGASAMTGKEKGAAAIMRRSNPHMHNVHCVAHKLALCTSQAAEKVPMIKKHQQILTDLYYYFKGSGKREARLHSIQEILDDPVLTVKEIHSVRWLSYFNALTAVWRTLDSLLTFLAEASTQDPKALGLKKKMASYSFIGTSYMLMDAMAPLTVLSQFFQTENIDVALVKVKLEQCMDELQEVREMKSPYLLKLKEDLTNNQFKGHEVVNTNLDLEKTTQAFIDNVVENLHSRFPMSDLLTSFGILALRPISFLSKPELEEYGLEEIDTLCSYYGQEKTVQWKADGVTETATSQPIIDINETKNEWSFLKKVVLAEKYPRDKMSTLWQLISKYHKEDFPNILKLAALAMTSAVHTAGCERGFSVQNKVLNKARNRLTIENQDKLFSVKLCPVPINYEEVLKIWKNKKERRVYHMS